MQSDPNLESPRACFSFEQLDRPLEFAQLFFLPWIKTTRLGESISVIRFLKSQYNAVVKPLKPDYLGSSAGSSHFLFKFSLSQSRDDNSIYLTKFYKV